LKWSRGKDDASVHRLVTKIDIRNFYYMFATACACSKQDVVAEKGPKTPSTLPVKKSDSGAIVKAR